MNNIPELTTLCYIEKDDKYLMLHRVSKKNDINKDKWIGVGGHLEKDESPEECLLREVKEETGLILTSYKYRGTITFVSGDGCTEYMALYTADGFIGEVPGECDEGVFEWVPKEDVINLNLWEGDRIFFMLLEDRDDFFSLKLVYDGHGVLEYAALDGKPMELLDMIDREGNKTGVVRARVVAHRYGGRHETTLTWVVRKNDSGKWDVLLQKRSKNKDSHPGCYDVSSGGHITSGSKNLDSAVREIGEELGLLINAEDLQLLGNFPTSSERVFHGKIFKNEQLNYVYLYKGNVNIDELKIQESELEAVEWWSLEEVIRRLGEPDFPTCIHIEELEMLKTGLESI